LAKSLIQDTHVLALGEGGDFHHKTSYEAPNFKFSKNCHTKHLTATFAKRLLADALLSIRNGIVSI
jgi:hypothetical protein